MPKSADPEAGGHAHGWHPPAASDPRHTRAWVGWPRVEAPETGGTALPAAGDVACWNPVPRPMGGLLPASRLSPFSPPTPPPPEILCPCNYGRGQHRAFSLLLKSAHETQQEREITARFPLIISPEVEVTMEFGTRGENNQHPLTHPLPRGTARISPCCPQTLAPGSSGGRSFPEGCWDPTQKLECVPGWSQRQRHPTEEARVLGSLGQSLGLQCPLALPVLLPTGTGAPGLGCP